MTAPQHAWRDYFDSEYLVGEALPDEGRTYTIADKARVGIEDKGETKHKLVLTMTDGTKWLTNVTNCTYLERMFKEKEPAAWLGKRVTLGYDPTVKFGKEVVGGIRVIGSPDITEPVKFMFAANSRQKPRPVTLKPTGTAKPPATVDPVTGEVGDDDIGFTDDAPHASEDTLGPAGDDAGPDGYTEAVEADYAPNGEIPGIGVEEVKARKKAS